jgi:NADH-quinone oxidoreductase subunit M
MPRLGLGLVVGMAASMGLPGLAGFWGEFGAVYAAWSPGPGRHEGWFTFFAVMAAVGAALAAAYSVRVVREVWAGDRTRPRLPDATPTEQVVIAAFVLGVLALGVYPVMVLDVTAPAVEGLVSWGVGR